MQFLLGVSKRDPDVEGGDVSLRGNGEPIKRIGGGVFLTGSLMMLALVCGCVTPQRAPLAVVVEGRSPEKVRVAAVTQMVETGWTPTSGDTLIMTFQKDLPFGAQLFVQEIGGQPARHQVTLTILPEGTNATKLLGHLAMITTRFGNPQRHENREQDHRLQWLLSCIRARALGEPLPPEPKAPPPSPSQFKALKGR